MVNGLIQRSWTRHPFRTEQLVDLRDGRVWTQNSPDFSLTVLGNEIASDLLEVAGEPRVEHKANGALRLTLTLAPMGLSALPAGLTVTRAIELYPGVAGLRQETWVNSPVPLVISGYSLDEARPQGANLTAEIHSFRAGADWREPEWTGPQLIIGDPHAGSWRKTTTGTSVSDTAQWLSLADTQDHRLFYVLERNDFASSMMSFTGGRAQARVDLSRDIIYLGPLEETGHVENPGPGPARQRVVIPGTPLRLEPVFTGVGLNRDDEPWQHYKYLTGYRMPPYRREITFNSNGVDADRISTGAKDDMDIEETGKQATIAAQLGIETFILDDGWQARSGDWCPDSVSDDPACQEPRRGSEPKVAQPRFPDSGFVAVRSILQPSGMNLGLWMSPLHFNPSAIAFQNNPQWACLPISIGLIALNQSDPGSGSSEAGIAQWNPEALSADGTKFIDYLEGRIRRAIDVWGVKYFKYDFTAWLDCVGVYPVDIYGYRESFMAMLDRVLADHPDVTIQMDETNDYRLFPFEAIARGPTWYQNGSPTPNEALHANYELAPFIPLYALGRNALRAGDIANYSVDYQMAVALLSHMTFFNNLRSIPGVAIPQIRVWTDYYKAHRQDFATFTYPLLDEDPFITSNWAAFQPWDPEAGRGALLVFRQDSDVATRTIRLRNVPPGNYRLYEAPAETNFLEYSASQLKNGISITLPTVRTAAVYRIEKFDGGTGGSGGEGGTGGSGGAGGAGGTGGSGGSSGGFPLCEPISGQGYCLSDIPGIGEILQGLIDTIYNLLAGGGDDVLGTLAQNCLDAGVPEMLCALLGDAPPTYYVDPLIGSTPPGFTNPGPTAPYGMVQPGPDTEGPLNFGGYYIFNALITGFSQVHMSAGVYKGGYFPMLPFTGDLTSSDDLYQGADHPVPGYSSTFDHATEIAEVGYYSALLSRYGVQAEITATPRAALHRYTFNDPSQAPRVLIDVSRWLGGYSPGSVTYRNDGALVGRIDADFPVFFAARANAAFSASTFGGATIAKGASANDGHLGVILDFAGASQPLLVKVGVSYTDVAGALANLDGEIPGWDFDAARTATVAAWDQALSRIEVEGGTVADRISFYTALYHAQQFPNVHSDVDGRYRGPDGGIHNDSRTHYSQFSSWDSYRGQNQLQAEIVPERYQDMIHSLIAFDHEAGYLPRWQEGSHDASHMSGDPIIPFIGEAWCRGDLDAATREALWPALMNLVTRRDAELLQKGYLSVAPADFQTQTELQPIVDLGPSGAGTTLEYGIADFSLALMAQGVPGVDDDDIAEITQRSLNYRNLLDPETKWIRPRINDAQGSWLTPFQPEFGYGFQEGTSWQYSWLAMHDYVGLISRMGGDQAVNDRLDLFFGFPFGDAPIVWPTVQNQITAFGVVYIGNQYAPGNEHDLEAPYVYNYTGEPWKTQAVSRAAASIYTPTPNGLPGNDDLGALSGWLVWNMLGLYPINPGTPLYVIGSPNFEKVTLHRPGGDLVIEAPGASALAKFVTGVQFNGQPLPRSWLVLPRGPTTVHMNVNEVPDMNWASAATARPPSASTHPLADFGCQQ